MSSGLPSLASERANERARGGGRWGLASPPGGWPIDSQPRLSCGLERVEIGAGAQVHCGCDRELD